jgi:predicted ATP-dependent endonuclease of OLD family
MRLKSISFHAFKSLLNINLKITDNCIGFVGINESGKSNVLDAIRVLGGERKLTLTDTPRMAKGNAPAITYVFKLDKDEYCVLQSLCKELFKKYISDFDEDIITDSDIIFKVEYDKESENEKRFFRLPGININNNLMVLLEEKTVDNYPILTKDGLKKLEDCVFITKSDYKLHESLESKVKSLVSLQEKLSEIQVKNEEVDEIDGDNDGGYENEENQMNPNENDDEILSLDAKSDPEIIEAQRKIKTLKEDVKEYKQLRHIKIFMKKNAELEATIDEAAIQKKACETELKKLKAIATLTPQQAEQMKDYEDKMKKSDSLISLNSTKINDNKRYIQLLEEPISEKYTDKKEQFIRVIDEEVRDYLNSLLPKVIFWEYDDKYLQKSEVNLNEILAAKDETDISRPLFNIFRIGCNIKSMDDLKAKIKESQDDPNERPRLSDKLTKETNVFLKRIWPEYDQDIKITIEKERLLFQICDPNNDDASYYSMNERSQGCQTFISFLLTIGVEANKGVLKDTVLLLDEPETHLHPSGIKNMLRELIDISNKNLVIYATHSLFMIDREKFDRHIIIKKEKELTSLQPAVSDRIGYFLQEEVLYGALDIRPNEEFNSTTVANFVFEGIGDAILFEHAYTNITKGNDVPFEKKNCKFYHGGGCGNISKYLKTKPIQLGSKWVFILDGDKPANELKKMIMSKYKSYIDTDIFIYQYNMEKCTTDGIVLEDLLPSDIKILAYNKIISSTSEPPMDDEKYNSLIKDTEIFTDQFNKICASYSLNQENVKGPFKETINDAIKDSISNKKIPPEEKYTLYNTWFKSVITYIKSKPDTTVKKDGGH